MPRPRLLSTSIMTPWVAVRSLEVRAGLAVLVGCDVPDAPIEGLRRAPERAMPCPCALLAKIARLTMSNHGVLTPIYYGKFLPPPATAGLVRLRAGFTPI
jgi:hypothetical protein